ncbi:hypothetical protein [Microbispora sp. NPDC049125]
MATLKITNVLAHVVNQDLDRFDLAGMVPIGGELVLAAGVAMNR